MNSPFLKERGKGISSIWSNTYPLTPFQLEGGARNCPLSQLERDTGDSYTTGD